MAYTFDMDLFSDLHKDAYGFRPRGHRFYAADTTDDQRQQMWDYVCADLDAEMVAQRSREAKAVEAFENQIQQNILLGAGNRDMAIRWILQSLNMDQFDFRYGGSRVCYELGLPYDMATIFDPFCKEMA